MLPKIIRRSGYMFKENPCLRCIVRSCCKTKCNLLDQWKRRFDLIKLPFQICYYLFMIIFVGLLLVIFVVVFMILWVAGCRDIIKIVEEEQVRY